MVGPAIVTQLTEQNRGLSYARHAGRTEGRRSFVWFGCTRRWRWKGQDPHLKQQHGAMLCAGGGGGHARSGGRGGAAGDAGGGAVHPCTRGGASRGQLPFPPRPRRARAAVLPLAAPHRTARATPIDSAAQALRLNWRGKHSGPLFFLWRARLLPHASRGVRGAVQGGAFCRARNPSPRMPLGTVDTAHTTEKDALVALDGASRMGVWLCLTLDRIGASYNSCLGVCVRERIRLCWVAV